MKISLHGNVYLGHDCIDATAEAVSKTEKNRKKTIKVIEKWTQNINLRTDDPPFADYECYHIEDGSLDPGVYNIPIFD